MPRFDRLEFESAPEPSEPSTPARLQEEHDQHYWLRQAGEERRQGHYENALRLYSRSLEIDRSLVEGWVGQVQMLVALGEYPEASLWGAKAL